MQTHMSVYAIIQVPVNCLFEWGFITAKQIQIFQIYEPSIFGILNSELQIKVE